MKTRSDIQGLRALAVALVVLSHANLLHLTGGYVGVDVFFVISGYLITTIILREYAANAARSNGLGWFSLRAFYLRRFKRIVPAAILVLVTTTVASFLLFNSVRAHGIAIDALWSAFFLANLHFINQTTDYFQQGFSTSPLQHFWSLAVEEQFYLVFPTLLLGALSIHGIKIRNIALNWRRRIGLLVGLISITSFIWAVIATNSNPASSYFSSFSRAWELGLGASLAICAQSSTVILPIRFRNLVSITGFLAILVSALLFTSSTPFPGFYTLIPTIGAALIIGLGINAEAGAETIIQKVSNSPPVTHLGNISYSVYLWHLPIIILASQKYAADSSKLWFKLVLIVFILLISSLTYLIYENPLRENINVPAGWYQNKFRSRRRSQNDDQSLLRQNMDFIAIGAVVIVALALILLPSHKSQDTTQNASPKFLTPSPTATNGVAGQTENTVNYANLLTSWQKKIAAGAELRRVPVEISPPMSHLKNSFNDFYFARLRDSSPIPNGKVAYLYGDSEAQRLSVLVLNALGSGWTIHVRSYPYCPIMDSSKLIDFWRVHNQCNKSQKEFFTEIGKVKPNLIVAMDLRGDIYGTGTDLLNETNSYRNDLLKSLSYMKNQSTHVLLIGAYPTGTALTDCVSQSGSLGSNCNRSPAAVNNMVQMEFEIANQLGIDYVDSRQWFCTATVCPPIIDNAAVLVDGTHTTSEIGLRLVPLLSAFLKQHRLL